jgi:hypothetical protein
MHRQPKQQKIIIERQRDAVMAVLLIFVDSIREEEVLLNLLPIIQL